MPGLEDLLDAGQHLEAELAELRPPVVDGGQAHGPQDAVGNRAGAGDLEEVAARGMVVEREHGASFSRKCQVGLRERVRSEEHTSELQSPCNLVCRLLLAQTKHNT